MTAVHCQVNGQAVEVDVDPGARLLDMLRVDLDLTGTKEGCGEGECGACTVILDGRPVMSCLVMAVKADEATIQTIEGVEQSGHLHPLQRAFIDAGAAQCGFCIPGFLVMAKAYLDRHPRPTCGELRVALAGNLCRCTGYSKIVEAILEGAEHMNSSTINDGICGTR